MKKLSLFCMSLVLFFSVFGCSPAKKTTPQTTNPTLNTSAQITAKIGVISYLSGQGAAYGEAITNGLKLAQEGLSKENGVNIELLIEDSAGKQDQALTAAQKLINADNVTAIIGPTLSTEMKAIGPVADQSGVPILGTSTTADGIPQIGEYVFRNSLPESLAIPASVKKAIEKYKIKKVALLYGNDDVFTKSGFDTMKKVAGDFGLEITTTEEFQKGQADYKAQLTKIKATNPDGVLCSALYNEGAIILDQARKMGLTVPFVGGNGFNSPQVITIAGEAATGLIVATPWFAEKNDQKVQDFVKKYEAKYGKKPDQFAAQAYDGLLLIVKAVSDAKSADRTKVRDALAAIQKFQGILGEFSFDKDGDVVMQPVVLEVTNGKFALMQ